MAGSLGPVLPAPGDGPRVSERRREGWRAPGWVVPIVAGLSGWFFAGWPGAAFGVVAGVLIRKSR